MDSTAFKIICTIIEQTEDITTLHNWCIATPNGDLNRTACAQRYRTIKIDQFNLAADRRRRGEPSLGQLLLKPEACGFLPVTFLKHLKLDFQQYDNQDDESDPLRRVVSNDIRNNWTSTVGKLNLKLSPLLKNASGLEELTHRGPLCPEWLNTIIEHSSGILRSLSLRNGCVDGHHISYKSAGSKVSEALNWDPLVKFKSLTRLEIAHVVPDECVSLVSALSCLENLQNLVLRVSPACERQAEIGLEVLLGGLPYVTDDDQRAEQYLPPSLRSFTLLITKGMANVRWPNKRLRNCLLKITEILRTFPSLQWTNLSY